MQKDAHELQMKSHEPIMKRQERKELQLISLLHKIILVSADGSISAQTPRSRHAGPEESESYQ